MLETFPWFRSECFGLIVEDLLCLPADTGVIAEGSQRTARARRRVLDAKEAEHARIRLDLELSGL